MVGPVEQPVTAVVLPDKASTPPPAPHAPTPVSGLENVPLITVPEDVLTLPLEPKFPMYGCVGGGVLVTGYVLES